MQRTTMKRPLILLLAASLAAAGCKSSSNDPVPYSQGISFTIKNLPTSRPGETYALWFGFPGGVAHSKENSPMHGGTTKYRLVSRFTVDYYGNRIGFDTTGAAARLGHPYAQAEQAAISVEVDTVLNDTLPRAIFMVHDFTGTVHQGISALTMDDEAALGYTFASMGGAFTLTPSVGAGSGTDVYLMSATSPSAASASITDLPPLPAPWQYALWVTDTSSKAPKNYYYGTFAEASGHDSDSSNDRFAYPGGRMPDDTTVAAIDMRSGNSLVLVTIEPGTFGSKLLAPFGVTLLSGPIPSSLAFFTPTALKNSVVLPTATVIINR